MTQACTIFTPTDDLAVASESIRRVFVQRAPQLDVEVRGPDARWDQIIARAPDGATLTLSSLVWIEADDEFSQLSLSMQNHFEQVKTRHRKLKKRVTQLIYDTELVIGIVADPEFDDTDPRWLCVLDIAGALDGFVFDGVGMRDSNGQTVIDQNGQSELAG